MKHLAPQDDRSALCQRLASLSKISCQKGWKQHLGELNLEKSEALPIAIAPDPVSWATWETAPLNDRDHIAWDQGRRVLWLGQVLQLPGQNQGYDLRGLQAKLALGWWAEAAQIFVNGQLVQEGDLFDCNARILLTEAAQGGESFRVAVRLVSPGHDPGALVHSELQFEGGLNRSIDSFGPQKQPEAAFIAQELLVLAHYIPQEPQIAQDLDDALVDLPKQLEQLQAGQITTADLDRSLAQIRQTLLPWSAFLKQRTLYLLGHAHLDLAWLWPIAETWEAAERTFRSVLSLQKDFPELIFGHSSPALFAWFQKHQADLFAEMQAGFAAGSWEAIAGLWVEPDAVVSGGEALVRQVLYGQRYTAEQLGQGNRVAWLPDTFGFGWQLPQILKQGGIQWFLTQKLSWNDSNTFPHALFHWQAPDGTAIPAVMTASIGQGVDPVAMATAAQRWEQQTGLKISLWLPGVGDHGGGPTRDMLEQVRRWSRSPFFPRLRWSQLHEFLDEIHCNLGNSIPLPTWDQDLYLELHRGCYTTHGDQKRYNRQTEHHLYAAELWASCASVVTGSEYPAHLLEKAWKKVLFNQFHDILPGSSIPEVYETANPHWDAALDIATTVQTQALHTLATAIDLPEAPHPTARPYLLFNALNWDRTELVEIPGLGRDHQTYRVFDAQNQPLATQISAEVTLLFQATVPALGYALVWIWPDCDSQFPPPPAPDPSYPAATWDAHTLTLTNAFLRVTLDPHSGEITECIDRPQDRSILAAPGNQFQFFRDRGQYWDAWNIDPNYGQYPLEPAQLLSLTALETGPLRVRVRGVWQFNQSRVTQDYCLEARSPLLKIVTQVDWRETHVLWKVAFPLSLPAPVVALNTSLESSPALMPDPTPLFTTEIACGAQQRPLKRQTPQEQAQWEVPMHRWADLSTPEQGVSLLNDCKYGCDAAIIDGQGQDTTISDTQSPKTTSKRTSDPDFIASNPPSSGTAAPSTPDSGTLASDTLASHTTVQLRLTLLRSPLWPNPHADRGLHHFTYALHSHSGPWQGSHTVNRAYELNQPLIGRWGDRSASGDPDPASSENSAVLPPTASLLRISSPDRPHTTWIPMALKRSEDNPQSWILRGYESEGQSDRFQVTGLLPLKPQGCVNGLEEPQTVAEIPVVTPTVIPADIPADTPTAIPAASPEQAPTARTASSAFPDPAMTWPIQPWQITSLQLRPESQAYPG